MKHILFIALIALLGTSSCKKWQHQYPEDTERTKLTPEERLIKKTWTLSQVTMNGIDYTDTVYNQIGVMKMYFVTSINSSINSKYLSGNASTNYEGSFGTVYSFFGTDIGMMREASEPTKDNVFCLFYATDQYDKRFQGKKNILQLEKTVFKIQFQNKNGDTIITNTFTIN